MRARHAIFGYTLLLALHAVGVSQAISATASVPAGQVAISQWKSIPEDSSNWRREPFKGPETTRHVKGATPLQSTLGAAVPDFALQGIMISNKRHYAIIDGRTVKTGDLIDGWNVMDISRHRVTVRRNKEKLIYDIYQGRIDRGTQ